MLIAGTTQAEIVTRDVDYKDGDTVLQGYLAYDDASTDKRPGVLVVHQWKGLGDYEKERCRMLAEMGYVAFGADIYGKGVRPKTTQEAGQQAGKYKGDRALLRQRVNAGLAELKKQPLVDAGHTAAIGYCFGGTTVLELARIGAEVGGVVSFHGGLDSPTPEDGKNIRCRVLVLHGGNDPNVPLEEVKGFLAEMQAVKTEWDFHAYGGAVHSFTEKAAGDDPSRGVAYNARADRESWAAMQRMFDDLFGTAAGKGHSHGQGSVPGLGGGAGMKASGASSASSAAMSGKDVPDSAEKTHPLGVGATAPDVSVVSLDGEKVNLLDRLKEKPTLLIVYRGGWCPYCNTHLAALKPLELKLEALGYQVLAMSPDRPEKLKETMNKHDLNYTLLSDSSMEASKGLGLAFRVDDATVEKYKGYGIDLEADSGYSHHLLPVPAAYLINQKGEIVYAHTDPDYKKRVDADELYEAARKAAD